MEPAFRSAKTMLLLAFAQVKGYFLSHRVMPRLSRVVPRIAGLRTGHTPFIHRSSTRLPTDQAGNGIVLELRGSSMNVRPGVSSIGVPSSAVSVNGCNRSFRVHVPWM